MNCTLRIGTTEKPNDLAKSIGRLLIKKVNTQNFQPAAATGVPQESWWTNTLLNRVLKAPFPFLCWCTNFNFPYLFCCFQTMQLFHFMLNPLLTNSVFLICVLFCGTKKSNYNLSILFELIKTVIFYFN